LNEIVSSLPPRWSVLFTVAYQIVVVVRRWVLHHHGRPVLVVHRHVHVRFVYGHGRFDGRHLRHHRVHGSEHRVEAAQVFHLRERRRGRRVRRQVRLVHGGRCVTDRRRRVRVVRRHLLYAAVTVTGRVTGFRGVELGRQRLQQWLRRHGRPVRDRTATDDDDDDDDQRLSQHLCGIQ